MATGGLAICVHQLPYNFPGKYTIGVTIYLINLFFFALLNLTITARFYWWKHSARNSWLHPTEALFIPTWLVTVGILLIGATLFGIPRAGPWFEGAIDVLYWIYCGSSILLSAISFLVMYVTGVLSLPFVFLVFPLTFMTSCILFISSYLSLPLQWSLLY